MADIRDIGAVRSEGLTVCLADKSFSVEVSGDFTLPDYQSEIRRILHVSQTVLPPSKYLSDSAVEFNGTVDYQVIYVGADGSLYSAPLSSEYSFSVPYDRLEAKPDGIEVLCDIAAESVNTRVTSPRRLSLRSRLRPCVRVFGELDVAVQTDAEMGQGVYLNKSTCTRLCVHSLSSDIISVMYNVPVVSDDVRVVMADTCAYVSSHTATEDGIACRGNVVIKLLCVSESSGEFKTVRGEVPFECDIESEHDHRDGECRIRGVVSDVSVSVGESGIDCNAQILLMATVCENRECEYVSDMYSSERECECEREIAGARYSILCTSFGFTLSERVALESTGIPQGAQIIETLATVRMDKCESVADKQSFLGTAVFTVIYRNDGEIYSADVSVPAKYQASVPMVAEAICYSAVADATDVKVRIDGGVLCIDAEILLCADAVAQSECERVTRVTWGEDIKHESSRLTVCFPSADDNAWSVAKKYRVAPERIIGDPLKDRYVIVE